MNTSLIFSQLKGLLGKKTNVLFFNKSGDFSSSKLNNSLDYYASSVVCNHNDNSFTIILTENNTELYEPDIRHILDLNSQFSVFCFNEKTCGCIIFTYENNIRKYLLIENESGHIGFPKGHIEYGESEIQTAVREVFEETSIDVLPSPNYKYQYSYVNKDGINKKCVYFLSEFKNKNVKIKEDEILNYWLVNETQALNLLNLKYDVEIFKQMLRDTKYD